MSVTVSVISTEDFTYHVVLDDSAMVDNPAEYRVSILRIHSEDPEAFHFSRLVKKDFIVNITYEPDIEWGVVPNEDEDEMMAAIGRAYLNEIGY